MLYLTCCYQVVAISIARLITKLISLLSHPLSQTHFSPCVPMRERHECHCMLFLTEENDFAGSETVVTVEEVQKLSGGFSS